MPTLEELLTATRSAVQELEERKRSLQQALDYKNVVQQALDTEWKGLSRAVLNFASGSSLLSPTSRPCYATSATRLSGGASASKAPTR